MNLRSLPWLLFAFMFINAAIDAQYNWIQNPATGHWYSLTKSTSSWTDAQAEAESLGGYLAVPEDAAENAWLWSTFGTAEVSDHGPWIGLYQDVDDPGYSEPAGAWKWVEGESSAYSNWDNQEPNNFGGSENFGHMHGSCCGGARWNDAQVNLFGGLWGIIEKVDGGTKVPLGGSITSSDNAGCFKVYVPTKWGGKLTVSSTDGTVSNLKDPDGASFTNGSETKQGKHGWYTFQVEGSSSYTVSNTFIQEGEAKTVPWNFWYFPLKPGTSLNLFDNPGACTKYDAKFALGTGTFDWEIANHRNVGAGGWWGHCGGSAFASIILEQPTDTHPDGFSQDELEGLAAEFFRGDLRQYRKLVSFGGKYQGKRVTTGTSDDADRLVHKFHKAMRNMLLRKKRAFWIELRQADGIARGAEIWNYGCYKYTAVMEEDPNASGYSDSEKVLQIRIKNNFICNDDFLSSSVSVGDPKANTMFRREQETEYILIFGTDGTLCPNGTIAGRKQNWLSMKIVHSADASIPTPAEVYIPWIMGDVTPAGRRFVNSNNFKGDNPNITAKNLIALGLKKNAGF